MKPLHIVIVSDTYYPIIDGVSRFIDKLGLLLHEAGHRVTFVIPKVYHKNFDYKSRPFNFITLTTIPVKIRDYYICFPNRKIQQVIAHCDLIIVNSLAFSAMYTLGYNHFYRKKVIEFVHIDEREMLHYTAKFPNGMIVLFMKLFRFMTKKMDRFAVATDKFHAKTIDYGADLDQIFRVPFGYDKKHVNLDRLREYKEKYCLDNKLVLLYLGRLSDEKNITTIVEVMGRLSLSYENIQCMIGGAGYKLDDIEQIIEEKMYNIELLGKVPEADLPVVYSLADLFLSPSFHEALGFTIVESLEYGSVPVINGKIGESIFNVQNSILLEDLVDVTAICEQIKPVLEDDTLLTELKKNAAELSARFSWEEFGKIWQAEIEQLLLE